jgi:flagellin-like hook-associated protein FlgL
MNMHSFSAARQSIGYMEATGANLSKSLGRLSSGLKVKIDEDAGGLAVSSKLDSVISRSVALAANVQNGLSFLESQDAAQGRLGDIITRMAELRQRFDDPTLNTGDGNNLNREFKELKEEIKSIAKGKFNGISLFSNESDNQSKLVVNTATDDRSTLREISRNLFFNSILDTNSTAGPIGANRTVQGSAGSFAGATVTPTGGTSPAQTINGAAGSTPAQLIQGVQGTTPNQVVNGGAPGTTPAQVAKGTEGATPNQTVNGGAPGTTPAQVAKGAQGSTLNQTVNGGASGTTTNQTVNAAGGSVANQSIKTLPVANLTGIGSGYDPIETAPTVTITGTNKGTLAGTTGIRPDGKLNVTFSGAGVPSSGANATELWNTGTLTNQDADTKPAVDSLGNVYFVGSSDGGSTVNAVNPADGTGLWSVAVGGEAICNPTLSSDEQTLFVGYNNGLRAFNTVDGSIRWSYASGAVQSSQPVLSNDGQTVYFGSNDDDLHAVSTVDGSGKWTFGTGSSIQSAPVVDSAGNIYVASTNRNVYKIQDNGATGTQVWVNNFSFSGAGTFQLNSGSSPALSNDESVLYLGDGNGNVTAINTALGSDNWGGSAQVPGNIRGKFAVGANDNVYFTSTDRRIFAFRDNGTTATQLGSFEVNGSNFTRQSPTVNALDQVFFTSTDGRVFALDGDNPGTWGDNINLNGVQWQANMGATTQSTPALDPSGNIVYVGDNQGRVFAYEDPIDITVAVASGTLQNPANLSSIGSGYDPTETAPTVTITGTDAGTLAGTSSINPDGTLNVTFAGASTGNGNIIVAVANGLSARPANLAGIGTGYDPAETPPVITVTGADKGTLAGTATIKADGTLDVAFSGNPMGNGNLTAAIATGVMRNPANLANIGSGYDPTETVPAVTITGTGAGTLAGTSSINPDGTINIAFSGAPTGTGNLNVAIANGLNPRPANLAGIGAGYDPTETAPVVTITGADAGTLTGTATVNADGTLNVTFGGNSAGVGNLTAAIANGTLQNPANLSNIGSGYDPTETVPAVTITGTDAGTLAGATSINADGTLNVAFSGVPTGPGNLNVAIANGLGARPVNLAGIGTGYDPTETAPIVTVTGADAGTLSGTTIVNADGTLNVTFAGNPTGVGNITTAIAPGVIRPPTNLTSIGSGYKTGEPVPAVTFVGANKGTLAGTSSVNVDGTLNVAITGAPTDTNNVTVNVATGVLGVNNLSGIGSGYTQGDPVPVVSFTGANAGTLAGTASINLNGTVDVSFSGNPTDTNNFGVQIANGLARAANLPGIGSGYDPAEAPPVVTITGASKNTLAGTTGINANGTLDLTFTGNPSDFSNLDVQVASGTLHAPPTLAGLGGNHNAASPPSVTISGADAGTLTGTASVNPDGTVNVSFGGTPSGTGSLNVNIAGDTSSSVISNQYLLELDGDLWDYSVAEFDNFTELIADARAQNGAEQNSLGTSWELLSTNLNQLEKATGRIKNADYAKEMTNLGKSQILNQSAAMMLGNQNRITSEALLTIQRLKNKL